MATEQFIEYVYYYPPYLYPPNINTITLDNYGMVQINYTLTLAQQDEMPSSYSSGGIVGAINYLIGGSVDINMTPEAYTSWYNANKSVILSGRNATLLTDEYNKLNQPIGNFANQQAATDATNYGAGYQFIPYQEYAGSGSTGVSNDLLNSFIALNTANLYAMVNPSVTPTNIIGNIAANIPWQVYLIFGIAGVIILISMLYNFNIFKATGEVVHVAKSAAPSRSPKDFQKGRHDIVEYRYTGKPPKSHSKKPDEFSSAERVE